jgi:hypothetical protein
MYMWSTSGARGDPRGKNKTRPDTIRVPEPETRRGENRPAPAPTPVRSKTRGSGLARLPSFICESFLSHLMELQRDTLVECSCLVGVLLVFDSCRTHVVGLA